MAQKWRKTDLNSNKKRGLIIFPQRNRFLAKNCRVDINPRQKMTQNHSISLRNCRLRWKNTLKLFGRN